MNNITREHWSRIFRRDVNQTNKYSIFSSCSHGTRKISHFKNTFIWKASQSRVKWRLSFCDILFCSRYSQNWVGMCSPLPKTLTLFMTKICDIPYPIYDLTKTPKPNLWPNPHIKIMSQTCIITRRLKNVKNRAFLTLLRSQKHYVIFSKKTLPENNLTGPVVQRLDNAIHRINRYPVDKCWQNKPRYPLDSNLSGG